MHVPLVLVLDEGVTAGLPCLDVVNHDDLFGGEREGAMKWEREREKDREGARES